MIRRPWLGSLPVVLLLTLFVMVAGSGRVNASPNDFSPASELKLCNAMGGGGQPANASATGVREFIGGRRIATPAGDAQIIKLTAEAGSFSVDVSATGSASDGEFGGSPPDATILAADDKGNVYPPISSSVRFTKDSFGRPSFAVQRYSFAGTLDPSARSLNIDVSLLTRLIGGPWSFSVSVAP